MKMVCMENQERESFWRSGVLCTLSDKEGRKSREKGQSEAFENKSYNRIREKALGCPLLERLDLGFEAARAFASRNACGGKS